MEAVMMTSECDTTSAVTDHSQEGDHNTEVRSVPSRKKEPPLTKEELERRKKLENQFSAELVSLMQKYKKQGIDYDRIHPVCKMAIDKLAIQVHELKEGPAVDHRPTTVD